jgi:hypothetical protein
MKPLRLAGWGLLVTFGLLGGCAKKVMNDYLPVYGEFAVAAS